MIISSTVSCPVRRSTDHDIVDKHQFTMECTAIITVDWCISVEDKIRYPIKRKIVVKPFSSLSTKRIQNTGNLNNINKFKRINIIIENRANLLLSEEEFIFLTIFKIYNLT